MINEIEPYINFILHGEEQVPLLKLNTNGESDILRRSSEMLEKIKDPSFLPTHQDLETCFGPQNKDEYEKLPKDVQHMLNIAYRKYMSYSVVERSDVFDFLNVEFINAIGNYLKLRALELGATPNQPITILETGAGNGRLTHFLTEYFTKNASDLIKIFAVDSGESRYKSVFPVEKLDHKQGLEKYSPSIVIWSWMPKIKDFTDDFRACSSVQEYLLLGPTVCCGLPWETYGNINGSFLSPGISIFRIDAYRAYLNEKSPEKWFHMKEGADTFHGQFHEVMEHFDKKPQPSSFDSYDDFERAEEQWTNELLRMFPPLYIQDGFEKQELEEVTKQQIGQHDGWPLETKRSITLSFKRISEK